VIINKIPYIIATEANSSHDSSNQQIKTITPIIRYINQKFIIMHKDDKSEIYILKDADEIAKENECVICFHTTEKIRALVPCGHTQYCDACIKKISESKECHICKEEVQSVIKIIK